MYLLPILIERRGVRKRWVQTVQMPVLLAVIASHDGALRAGTLLGRVPALVAQYKIAFAVAQSVIIRLIIRIARSITVRMMSAAS